MQTNVFIDNAIVMAKGQVTFSKDVREVQMVWKDFPYLSGKQIAFAFLKELFDGAP